MTPAAMRAEPGMVMTRSRGSPAFAPAHLATFSAETDAHDRGGDDMVVDTGALMREAA